MKKLAEELLKIESNARRVEAEKAELEEDCRLNWSESLPSIITIPNFHVSNVQGL